MVVKQGDLFPDVETTVKDGNGVVVDVSNSTILFYMRSSRTPTVKVNGSAGAIVNGPQGQIKYAWVGTDTDTPGTYEAEFRITPSGGADAYRVPTDGYITVVVEEKLA